MLYNRIFLTESSNQAIQLDMVVPCVESQILNASQSLPLKMSLYRTPGSAAQSSPCSALVGNIIMN